MNIYDKSGKCTSLEVKEVEKRISKECQKLFDKLCKSNVPIVQLRALVADLMGAVSIEGTVSIVLAGMKTKRSKKKSK